MELEPGIHQLTFGHEPFPGFPPPNAFLVTGTGASVLIDCGWEDDADHRSRMGALREAGGPPLSEIIVTHRHPDHGGGTLAMHRETGAPIAAHPLERDIIERDRLHGEATVANELLGGEVRRLGGLTLHVLFTPGHTAGCLAIYVPERGALFSTDTVMQISTTVIRPQDGKLADYSESLEQLRDVKAKTMYPGHGGPVTDPQARLEFLIDHRKRREEELLAALAAGPQTATQLRETVYRGLPEVRHSLAEAQITTGLMKLVDEGRARPEGERYALI